MKTISTTLVFALLATLSFGQQLIPEALTPTEHNTLGDPITNVIDPDGARQGDWVYQDIYEKPIVKEHYQNHVVKQVYYSVLNSTGTPEWRSSREWRTNPEPLTTELKKAVADKFGELDSDQQIVVLFNAKGGMRRFAALGKWNRADAQRAELAVRAFLKNNALSIIHETIIFL